MGMTRSSSPEDASQPTSNGTPSRPRAAISAIGHYLPEPRMTNHDLEQIVETSDEWIRKRTGIRERRILEDDDKACAFMAAEAAKDLMRKNDIDPTTIEVVIVATVTPDMLFPATSCLVQDKIGASNAWGFDLSAACSGFLYGLATGAQFIESGQHERVLVIGSDKMSSIVNYTDRTTCVLFGDGAGAALLEPDDECGLVDTELQTDGSKGDLLCMQAGGSLNPATHETVDERMHYLYQDGRSVFRYAVNAMSNVCVEVMERNEIDSEDVDYFVPHQANKRIIDAAAHKMGLSDDQVMLNIDRYGNTTAATIPLCLHDWESELSRGDTLILAVFGGGFTWGAGYLRWAYEGSNTAHSD